MVEQKLKGRKIAFPATHGVEQVEELAAATARKEQS
jgi:hypothetical protein